MTDHLCELCSKPMGQEDNQEENQVHSNCADYEQMAVDFESSIRRGLEDSKSGRVKPYGA